MFLLRRRCEVKGCVECCVSFIWKMVGPIPAHADPPIREEENGDKGQHVRACLDKLKQPKHCLRVAYKILVF